MTPLPIFISNLQTELADERAARRGRSFPLPEDTPPEEVLTHLNLLDRVRPTHAAIRLFAESPQRFPINSEVRCARFHGFEAEKPIPSYQVYKGTLFDLIQHAEDFVLSKIDLWTGDRSQGVQAPTAHEIPQEVVAEAIARMGTGIRDMIRRCREAGLPEPIIRIDAGEWVTTIPEKPRSKKQKYRLTAKGREILKALEP